MTDLAALAQALAACPTAGRPRAADFAPTRPKGVNHDHYRLRDRGLLLRVPRATPWAGDPAAQLEREAAAFRRAAPAGVTPKLIAVLAPAPDLPRGALLVEEIRGDAPRLPRDLPALALALARLHALPLPAPADRPPLPDHGALGPVAATFELITSQRIYLDQARLPAETRTALDQDYAWAQDHAAKAWPADQPLALVGTDTHPGNFILRADRSAVLVDLERVCYGSPAIDLAHATLYTSTRWDIEVEGSVSRPELEAFYRTYLRAIGPQRAGALRPWLFPARRLTWLRTMMWAARWRVLADRGAIDLDPGLAAHIRGRLADFFAPERVAALRAEWLAGADRMP